MPTMVNFSDFAYLKLVVKLLIGQKLLENARFEKYICDILNSSNTVGLFCDKRSNEFLYLWSTKLRLGARARWEQIRWVQRISLGATIVRLFTFLIPCPP